MHANFMLWVDLLPDVAALVRDDRDKLAAQVVDAHRLELRAAALRSAVQEGRSMIRDRVIRHWVMHDIEQAAAEASRRGQQLPPGFVDDTELRAALEVLDAAVDPLQVHQALDTLRQARKRSVFRVSGAPEATPGFGGGQPPSA